MTDYPYEPPQREFQDTILAFNDFVKAGAWSAHVENDPLGTVNKVVSLVCSGRVIKSVLWPVPAGMAVACGYDSGSPRIRSWTSSWEQVAAPWDSEVRPPSWYVTVGGTRVIDVPEHETRLPIQPKPAVPLWKRMRTVLKEQVRADADWIAARLGYHREDHCDNYGDW